MIECTGNIWDALPTEDGSLVALVVTTNGTVNRHGAAVMGRGIAKEAKDRFPTLPFDLGFHLECHGNVPAAFAYDNAVYDIWTLPVKYHWYERASIPLIQQSIARLEHGVRDYDYIYMPRPGCGNGRLSWEEVKPMLAHLDDRYHVYSKGDNPID